MDAEDLAVHHHVVNYEDALGQGLRHGLGGGLRGCVRDLDCLEPGYLYHELRALPEPAAARDRPARAFDHALDDGEPQSRALLLAVRRLHPRRDVLHEGIEQLRHLLFGHAAARVRHLDVQRAALRNPARQDGYLALFGELRGVADKVD